MFVLNKWCSVSKFRVSLSRPSCTCYNRQFTSPQNISCEASEDSDVSMVDLFSHLFSVGLVSRCLWDEEKGLLWTCTSRPSESCHLVFLTCYSLWRLDVSMDIETFKTSLEVILTFWLSSSGFSVSPQLLDKHEICQLIRFSAPPRLCFLSLLPYLTATKSSVFQLLYFPYYFICRQWTIEIVERRSGRRGRKAIRRIPWWLSWAASTRP